MSIVSWYIKVLKDYVTFSGRAPRVEYWMFVLGNLIIGIVLLLIGYAISGSFTEGPMNTLLNIYNLAILLPSLAVSARRLHDIDMSAWWLLLNLIPLLGALVLLYFFVQKGTEGENRFGSVPSNTLE